MTIDLSWNDNDDFTEQAKRLRADVHGLPEFGSLDLNLDEVEAPETGNMIEVGGVFTDLSGFADGDLLVVGLGEAFLPGFEKATMAAVVIETEPEDGPKWVDVNDLEES